MNLRKKVPLIAVLLCASSFAMIGALSYIQARNALTQAAVERLTFVSETKRDRLSRVMQSNFKVLGGLAGSETVRQGASRLKPSRLVLRSMPSRRSISQRIQRLTSAPGLPVRAVATFIASGMAASIPPSCRAGRMVTTRMLISSTQTAQCCIL